MARNKNTTRSPFGWDTKLPYVICMVDMELIWHHQSKQTQTIDVLIYYTAQICTRYAFIHVSRLKLPVQQSYVGTFCAGLAGMCS